MKVDRMSRVRTLHAQLRPFHRLPAAVALLALIGSAKNARKGLMRQTAIDEFFLNHETHAGFIHGWPCMVLRRDTPDACSDLPRCGRAIVAGRHCAWWSTMASAD